jgi:hypothetical protein
MRTYVAVALCGLLGCSVMSQPAEVSTSAVPQAVIERDSAWFVFPKEADSLFAWNVPGSRAYEHAPERIWTVQIAPHSLVSDIVELTVRQEWRRDATGRIVPLADLVRGSTAYAGHAATDCVCIGPETDPAIRASVHDQSVRIVVHGQAAIARWLSHVQDSVTFTRIVADTSEHPPYRTISQHAVVVRRATR